MNETAIVKTDETAASKFVDMFREEARLDAVYKQFAWLESIWPRKTVKRLNRVKRFDADDLTNLQIGLVRNVDFIDEWEEPSSREIRLLNSSGQVVYELGAIAYQGRKFVFFGPKVMREKRANESVKDAIAKLPQSSQASYIIERYNDTLTIYKPNKGGQTLRQFYDEVMATAKALAEKEAETEVSV